MRRRQPHRKRILVFTTAVLLFVTSLGMTEDVEGITTPPARGVVATFSIVACDLETGQWGVATQSRVLAVGSIVPFAEAQVGAIATQSWANTSFGPRGLKMLVAGESAQKTLDTLLESDKGREHRQVAIVDREGRVAHFTGTSCSAWAGAKAGEHFVCLGNILTDEAVVNNMALAFQKTEGPLADRMVAALRAAQAAGGDRRGRQSAALLVVKKEAGYSGFDDRYIDLRVDDNPRPIEELERLLDLRLGRKKAE